MSDQPLSQPLRCPTCGETTKQHRAGKNATGTFRRECRHCGRTYTPEPKTQGYDVCLRRQALKLYVDGTNFRRIGRHLGVNPQTVANWVDKAAANIPPPPPPQERQHEIGVETLEMDEIFTFISQKRARLHLNERRQSHALHLGLRRGLGARGSGDAAGRGRCASRHSLFQ